MQIPYLFGKYKYAGAHWRMKIFSILLLQCKKVGCRMESSILPTDCEVLVKKEAPKEKDVEFMDAQIEIICGTDPITGQFLLIEILESIKSACSVSSDELRLESLVSSGDLARILEESSVQKVLSQESLANLYSLLFHSVIKEGVFVCSKCQERYPVSCGIVDYI